MQSLQQQWKEHEPQQYPSQKLWALKGVGRHGRRPRPLQPGQGQLRQHLAERRCRSITRKCRRTSRDECWQLLKEAPKTESTTPCSARAIMSSERGTGVEELCQTRYLQGGRRLGVKAFRQAHGAPESCNATEPVWTMAPSGSSSEKEAPLGGLSMSPTPRGMSYTEGSARCTRR